ncbi:MAG: 4-(cytidine 5'-diphospho)-2-C-methyl-D-erythritol kinase [Actinobacteria bacterium]|nr:4-(cytidine 5'-diphospho)-2-C-methyl-D-erythritol kinase [Actinomycetota bacterium]MCL6094641.1 4-(cytidine 5'-diphospho)-2-C-methyl-D-erythritol kinase [Actinomycetota bacterium]
MSVVTAFAKLTLTLRITGRRQDGYHLIDAMMVLIDLADELEFSVGDGLEVVDERPEVLRRVGGLESIPLGPDNLIDKALRAVGRWSYVRLIKRIPAGAGLGGGSADAAAVLRWAGTSDLALAASLGADVPFCMIGGRAQVSGIGEILKPLPFEESSYVLLIPPLSVSTAEVFHAWDVLGGPTSSGNNDLEQAAFKVEPRLKLWRDCLAEATREQPSLAGSGSTWFVRGDKSSLGLSGRDYLVIGNSRAALMEVHTVKPLVPLPLLKPSIVEL